jgi:hypothetical protein
VRDADLEHGRTRSLHDWFFRATADLAEEGRPFR